MNLVPSNIIQDTKKLTELLQEGTWKVQEPEAQEERASLFVNADSTEASMTASIPSTSIHNIPSSSLETASESGLSRYIGNFNLEHVDFDVKSKNYGIFRIHDYGWKEDGYELVRRFLPGAASLLDEEFDHIYNLTYNT
jgi:hypothetical protein